MEGRATMIVASAQKNYLNCSTQEEHDWHHSTLHITGTLINKLGAPIAAFMLTQGSKVRLQASLLSLQPQGWLGILHGIYRWGVQR